MAIVTVGTEMVQCVRIAHMISRHGEQFLERVFTPAEIEHGTSSADPTAHFARRWVAKESVFKALRCRGKRVRWTDIEVVPDPVAGHAIRLHHAAERLAAERSIRRIHLSMGGCRTQVVAYVVMED
ncbi:MAG: holo-ACP synthase [Planctomycetota bacterium]